MRFFAFIDRLMKTLPKARILVTRFPYAPRWGGEEVHTVRLMKELDQKGHEAFFLGSCPILLREFKKHGFLVKKAWLGKPPASLGWLLLFSALSPFLFLWAGILLGKAWKQWRVNALYALSFGEKLLMTPWAKLFGMRVLWLEHARIGPWFLKNPWRFFYRWLSRRVTVVVTSQAMLPHLTPWAKHVVAIPCGVILDTPEPLPEDLLAFLKEGFSVGTVARLTKDKGVDILADCVQSKPEMRLIVVGDGPLRKTLEAKASSGRLRLFSSLSRGQLMSFYRELNLFVLASTEFDPFGMAAAEAMAMGTPVLLSSASGMAEEVHHDKEAFLVEPKRIELDKALKKIIKAPDRLSRVGAVGQAFVLKHHRLEPMVNGFEKLLTKS